MARVFVTRRLPGPALDRLTAAGHELDVWAGDLPPSPPDLREHTAAADALLCLLTDRIDGDLLDHAPKLMAIANYAVGSDNIDLDATTARNIPVGVTPDVLTEATADLTFALVLAGRRRLLEAAQAVPQNRWRTWEPAGWLGHDVHGATLGIVGMGRIGSAVARRATGFDMTVIHTARDQGAPLDDLLAQSDIVSLHCPLTAETRHLIDEAALNRMKPDALLVNTARGAIVDQQALEAALRNNTIGGAALDVTDPEPLPPDDPLLAAPNLIVLPHIGSATRSARHAMAERAVDNLLAALDDRPMPYPARG